MRAVVIEKTGGLSVVEAADGEAAVDMARRLQPALVLVSPTLPRVSGLEVCRALKSDPRTQTIPVVVASGGSSTRAEAIAAGADDFIPIPFTFGDLVAKIRQHIPLAKRPH